MENLDCYELLNVEEDDTLIVIFNKYKVYTLSKYKSEDKNLLNAFCNICNVNKRKMNLKKFCYTCNMEIIMSLVKKLKI